MPKGIACKRDITIVTTIGKELLVLKDNCKVSDFKVDYVPTAVAISPNGVDVAIGSEVKIK